MSQEHCRVPLSRIRARPAIQPHTEAQIELNAGTGKTQRKTVCHRWRLIEAIGLELSWGTISIELHVCVVNYLNLVESKKRACGRDWNDEREIKGRS